MLVDVELPTPGVLVSRELGFVDTPDSSGIVTLGAAVLSEDGKYRYVLHRRWAVVAGEGPDPGAVFIMLNPSTADAAKDDPTIRRCIGFARAMGCNWLDVVNLFAWRATDPDQLLVELRRYNDIIGPANDQYILKAAEQPNTRIVCAWGGADIAGDSGRDRDVCALLHAYDLNALAETHSGAPRHPLYLPKTATPQLWKGALAVRPPAGL